MQESIGERYNVIIRFFLFYKKIVMVCPRNTNYTYFGPLLKRAV